MIDSSKYRTPIRVYTPVAGSRNEFNEIAAADTFVVVFAWIAPLSAKERTQGQQVSQAATHRIEIRYRSGVDSSCYFKLGPRRFNIEGVVNENERNEKLICSCIEVS